MRELDAGREKQGSRSEQIRALFPRVQEELHAAAVRDTRLTNEMRAIVLLAITMTPDEVALKYKDESATYKHGVSAEDDIRRLIANRILDEVDELPREAGEGIDGYLLGEFIKRDVLKIAA